MQCPFAQSVSFPEGSFAQTNRRNARRCAAWAFVYDKRPEMGGLGG